MPILKFNIKKHEFHEFDKDNFLSDPSNIAVVTQRSSLVKHVIASRGNGSQRDIHHATGGHTSPNPAPQLDYLTVEEGGYAFEEFFSIETIQSGYTLEQDLRRKIDALVKSEHYNPELITMIGEILPEDSEVQRLLLSLNDKEQERGFKTFLENLFFSNTYATSWNNDADLPKWQPFVSKCKSDPAFKFVLEYGLKKQGKGLSRQDRDSQVSAHLSQTLHEKLERTKLSYKVSKGVVKIGFSIFVNQKPEKVADKVLKYLYKEKTGATAKMFCSQYIYQGLQNTLVEEVLAQQGITLNCDKNMTFDEFKRKHKANVTIAVAALPRELRYISTSIRPGYMQKILENLSLCGEISVDFEASQKKLIAKKKQQAKQYAHDGIKIETDNQTLLYDAVCSVFSEHDEQFSIIHRSPLENSNHKSFQVYAKQNRDDERKAFITVDTDPTTIEIQLEKTSPLCEHEASKIVAMLDAALSEEPNLEGEMSFSNMLNEIQILNAISQLGNQSNKARLIKALDINKGKIQSLIENCKTQQYPQSKTYVKNLQGLIKQQSSLKFFGRN